ncbi:unnamed protein product [Mytilus coruscus]|uniref:SAP domain-containing protein n=1 Tax=Mytilus coruscus TaxID=42192 RepID=A0A6J8A0S5_MYTCO|nr:unnamed protein product [Mytilus coruscus]
MEVVTLLFLLQNVMSIYSWSLDNVCDVDDIKCQNPQISNPGEIMYGQCYYHAALRRLLKVSFLTCLKECIKTSTCSSVSYRRSWKMCDINGNMNSEVELVQENGCFSSNISSWSKAANDCSYRCITDILEYIIQKNYQEELIAFGPLDLKLRFACDGAKISKKLNSVRGVMKLLHDRNDVNNASMSPDDEHTLFFFTEEENHYSLKKYGHHTFLEMARLQEEGFEIDGKKINVEWILTCDWKALCLLRGINAANSDYFCLWCHCRKREICNFSIKEWPIQRTQTEQNEYVANCSTGYIRQDMCSFIDFTSMAPDDLHLRIRLSLKLPIQERGDDKSTTSIKKLSQPSVDELRKIIKYSQLHNVLDNTKDKHFVSVESLSVNQLRNEVVQRGLNNKGKTVLLVARLKEAVGNCKFRKKANASRLQVSFDYENDDDDDEISLDVDALQTLWGNFHSLMESLRAFPGSEEY